jgi:hypothetical protein
MKNQIPAKHDERLVKPDFCTTLGFFAIAASPSGLVVLET